MFVRVKDSMDPVYLPFDLQQIRFSEDENSRTGI